MSEPTDAQIEAAATAIDENWDKPWVSEASQHMHRRRAERAVRAALAVSPPTEPNAESEHRFAGWRATGRHDAVAVCTCDKRFEGTQEWCDHVVDAAIVRAEKAEALLRDGLAATKDEYPVIHWRNRVRALLGEGTAPCGHEWRVSEHVTVRCSLDSGHVPALHSDDDSDGIRRVWLDEVQQWRPPEAPMSASAAGVHMRRAHEADDDGHPLRVLLGDRVFVLIALVRSGIEALHSIDPDVDGGLFHSIGGPTGCTLTVGGHEYRVTIEGPV